MNNKNFTLMAFAVGQESTESKGFDRYIGVGSVQVLAINPTKAELEKHLNIQVEEEPVYTGVQDRDGKQVPYSRIELLLKTVPNEESNIDDIIRISMFLQAEYRYNREGSKIQVIDIYGRTAWVTKEDLENHNIPIYSNGNPANLDKDYRPVYRGEEALTNFLIAFLNIPSPQVYKDKKWVPADNLDLCHARLDNVKDLFKGDFKELKTIISYQKNNKVKVLFGVRTNSEGKLYQTFYDRKFLKNSINNYAYLEKDLTQTKEAGGYPTSEFQVCPLKVYEVSATTFNQAEPNPADNPFGDPAENPFF